eukprot:SAG31_NODE_1555_length_7895_cov_46.107748_7_plen_107_part_00
MLNTLVEVAASNRSAAAANPGTRVRDVAFVGFEFTQTRATFLSERYEVPSSGDWSVVRGGAVVAENVIGFRLERCLFNQTGGNAVVFSVRGVTFSFLCNYSRKTGL